MEQRYSNDLGYAGHQGINYGNAPTGYLSPVPLNPNVLMGPHRGASNKITMTGPPFTPLPVYQQLMPSNNQAFATGPAHAQPPNVYYNNVNGAGDSSCGPQINEHVVNINGGSNGGTYIANANFLNRPNIYGGNFPPHPPAPPGFNCMQMSTVPNQNGAVNMLPNNNMPPGSGNVLLATNTSSITTSSASGGVTGQYAYAAVSSCNMNNQLNTAPVSFPHNAMIAYYNVNGNSGPPLPPPPPPPPSGPGIWLPGFNTTAQPWANPSAHSSFTNLPANGVNQGTQTSNEVKTTASIGIQCTLVNSEPTNSIHSGELKAAKMATRFDELLQDIDQTMSMPSIVSAPNIRHQHDEDNNAVDAVDGGIGNGAGAYITRAEYDVFIRLAQYGSDIAEKVASAHRHRPCFKKIDSLCARLRQDLMRQDSVLPNINSQGYAWAVKDFIFVFTRIINAWIIMKGYVYNTQLGLSRVRSCLTPLLIECFLNWQEITFTFVMHIIKSFVNLDNLVQTQKNGFHKPTQEDNSGAGGDSVPLMRDNVSDILSEDNVLNRNYIFTNVSDLSEVTQHEAEVNGTYFRTGTYKPIKKTDLSLVEPIRLPNGNITNSPPSLPKTVDAGPIVSANAMPNGMSTLPPSNSTSKTSTKQASTAHMQQDQYLSVMPFSVTSNIPILPTINTQPMLTSTPISQPNNVLMNTRYNGPTYPELVSNALTNAMANNVHANSNDRDGVNCNQQNLVPYMPPTVRSAFENRNKARYASMRINKIQIMGERLMELNAAEYFYRYHRIKDLFPDFFAKHCNDFEDLYTIISKIHRGNTYIDVFQIVNHAKRVIFIANKYLRMNNNKFLSKSIRRYEEELNRSVISPPFEMEKLDQVIGSAREEEIFNAVYRNEVENLKRIPQPN